MRRQDVQRVLELQAQGLTPDEIADRLTAENPGYDYFALAADDRQALDEDDSDWADERRAERRGMGEYDFPMYPRNDAGEFIGYM